MGPSRVSLYLPTKSKTSQITAQQHTLWRRPTSWRRTQWPPSWSSGRINWWCSGSRCSTRQQQITSLINKCSPPSIQPSCVSPPIQKQTNPLIWTPITQEDGCRSTTQGINNIPWMVLWPQSFSNLPPIRKFLGCICEINNVLCDNI